MPSMELPLNTGRFGWARQRPQNALPYAFAVAAVAAFSFLSGGYIVGRSTPVAVAFLGLAAVWVWFLRRRTWPSWLFLAALVALALFTLWTGASVLWSLGPDLTWVAFNRTAFYLAVFAVLGLTSVRGLQLRTAGYGSFAVILAVAVYAFLGKATPDVVTHAHRYARLDSPVGYWNVLALMMVIGLCVGLSLMGDRRAHPVWRVVVAAAAVPMCFTFYFSFSRGGWVALAVALLLYFAFTTNRLASLFSLAAVVTPVAFVLWRLRGLDTLSVATTDGVLRAAEGATLLRWSLAAVAAAAVAQTVIALAHRFVPWPRRLRLAFGTVVVVALVAGVGGGSWLYVDARGGMTWVQERVTVFIEETDDTQAGEGTTRLISLNTGRPPLWREALDQSQHVRLSGAGAGTFPFTHYRFRDGGGVTKHAHSQWFNVLSELGVVGLALFVAAMALCVAAMIGNPFSHRRDLLHPLLVAMQAGVIAFFVHISWDWDWDMAAIGTLVFVFMAASASYRMTRAARERRRELRRAAEEAPPAGVGDDAGDDAARSEGTVGSARDIGGAAGDVARAEVLVSDATAEAGVAAATSLSGGEPADAGGGRPAGGDAGAAADAPAPRRRRAHWAPRVVAGTALVLLAVSWLPPYLAGRAESAALAASSEGDVVVALEHARRAARLDPLAVTPLLVESSLLQQQGRNLEALQKAEAATRLQPANHEAWYRLGRLQLTALGRKKAARASFRRALALNPEHAGSLYELEVLAN
jgi:hypothetical protein